MALHSRVKRLEQEASAIDASANRRESRKPRELSEQDLRDAMGVLEALDLLTPQALFSTWNPENPEDQATWRETKAYIESLGFTLGEPLAAMSDGYDDDGIEHEVG